MTPAVRHIAVPPLQVFAAATVGLLTLPLLYVSYLALSADSAVWGRLWATRIPELLTNTISLAAAVSLAACALGVSLAWLVVRFDFPGRRIWEWALVLPLAMPTYVLAYVYTFLLGTGGPFPLFPPHGFAGTTFVMTLDTFPFVYLLSRAAWLNLNVSFEEAAQACGASRLEILRRVTLPLLRPAIVAGLALVILYVVSDFGAVSLLRYQTLTYAVYQQMTSRYNYTAAGILSLLLVVIALVFLVTERWSRRKSRFYQTTGRYRAPKRRRCGPLGALVVTGYLMIVLGAAFLVPAALLVRWSLSAIAQGAVDARFFGFIWNSTVLSAVAATCAVTIGIPLAYLATRCPSRFNLTCLQAAYAGYALPGPVAALALLVLFSQAVPFWYGSVAVLVVAYIVHFLPAGLQSLEPALQQVTPNLEEAARSLGLGMRETLQRVTIPLVRNGVIAAWVLMSLQCMKELPATLLLRPVGFDTLAIRVWLEASEEYYQLAAPPALLIVALTLPALRLLVSKDWRAA